MKEEQTHLAVPWDAQNHPFLLIIQLWIIASQTFPYCSAAHCFLQLSLSPATTLPPIPGIAKAVYCQLCHSHTLDDPTPEDGKHVAWFFTPPPLQDIALFISASQLFTKCGGKKKKNKPPASSCNSCWSWRTDLQRAQLPPSQEAHTPLCLLYSDRARLPRALLTYLCAG